MEYTDKMLKEMQEVFAEGMKYNGAAESPSVTTLPQNNIEVAATIENNAENLRQ